MNHLNTILIEGNLTRNPQFVTAKDGCSFTIANNRYYLKDGKWVNEASFFIIFAYGKLGESCLNYLTKGRGVRVCGRLKQVTSKRNNLPQDFVFIIAEHVEFQPNKNLEKSNAMDEQSTDNNTVSEAKQNEAIGTEEQDSNAQTKIYEPNGELGSTTNEPSIIVNADSEDEAKANAATDAEVDEPAEAMSTFENVETSENNISSEDNISF